MCVRRKRVARCRGQTTTRKKKKKAFATGRCAISSSLAAKDAPYSSRFAATKTDDAFDDDGTFAVAAAAEAGPCHAFGTVPLLVDVI